MLEWIEDMIDTQVKGTTLTDGCISAIVFFYDNGMFNDHSRTKYPTSSVLNAHLEL